MRKLQTQPQMTSIGEHFEVAKVSFRQRKSTRHLLKNIKCLLCAFFQGLFASHHGLLLKTATASELNTSFFPLVIKRGHIARVCHV